MSSLVVLGNKLDVNNIEYSDIKTNQSGGKHIFIKGPNQTSLFLQTPIMRVPFGLKTFDENNKRWSLDLSFKNNDKFLKIMQDFNEKILNDATKKTKKWFNKTNKKEVLQELYSSSVKYSKNRETGEIDNKYPPTLKLNVTNYDNKWDNVKVFDKNRNILDEDLDKLLIGGCEVRMIIKCKGIWFINGKFGCNWALVQCETKTNINNEYEYSFIDSDDEDIDELSSDDCDED